MEYYLFPNLGYSYIRKAVAPIATAYGVGNPHAKSHLDVLVG